MLDHSGSGPEPGGQCSRVTYLAFKVRDDPAIGAGGGVPQFARPQSPQSGGQPEGEQLQGDTPVRAKSRPYAGHAALG